MKQPSRETGVRFRGVRGAQTLGRSVGAWTLVAMVALHLAGVCFHELAAQEKPGCRHARRAQAPAGAG
jgi:hypothetical protein